MLCSSSTMGRSAGSSRPWTSHALSLKSTRQKQSKSPDRGSVIRRQFAASLLTTFPLRNEGDQREEEIMGTLTLEIVRPAVGVRAAKASPIIVATDGREQSDEALVAGGLLAGAGGENGLRVITVLKPMPIVSPEAQLPVSPDVEASRRAEAKRSVRDQLVRVCDVPLAADVEV